MGVGPLESLNQRRSNLSSETLEAGGSGQVTNGSVVVVARDAMISGPLYVESSQVQTREGNVFVLKQMVGDLGGHELVQSLHGGCGHSPDQLIQHARLIQLVRVEEELTQLHVTSLTEVSCHSCEVRLEQAVTKPEGCSGKLIQDGWVACFIISTIVSFWQQVELIQVDGIPSKDSGKEFIPGDMSVNSNGNPPGLMIQLLITPLRIELSQ